MDPTIEINDPGKRSSHHELATGAVDTRTKPAGSLADDAPGSFKDYARIFSYADRLDWCLNTVAFVSAAASGCGLPFMTLIFGGFTTKITNLARGLDSPEQFMSDVNKYSLYFIYLFIAKFTLTYLFTVCITISATRTTKSIRTAFLRATLSQEISHFDRAAQGAVSIHVTTNGNLISNGIAEKLGQAIQAVSGIVVAFILAFIVQWKLTLITLAISPVLIVVTFVSFGVESAQESRMLRVYSAAGSLAEEIISSMKCVTAFDAGKRMLERYDNMLLKAKAMGMKKSLNLGVLYSTEFFLVYCGYALCFWQGIRMFASGEIDQPGKVVTVESAIITATTSITAIVPCFMAFTSAASAANELFRIIDKSSAIDPLSEAGQKPSSIVGDVEFRDVQFSYPTRPDAKILNSLSLTIPAQKTTAIVGASGSGKSTMVGLIERWYNPQSGAVYLDGQEVSTLNLRWLRTKVRLVQQEPVLFNGTVFENVCNGLVGTGFESSPRDEKMKLVIEACKFANANEFIERLPKGYDSEVGESARTISGGQKQRIAIARSIISNPKVLLLDEATSALDPHAEKIVQAALDKVSKNRTTMVIAHKLSTVQNADNIIVLSKGAVVEQGTHQELLKAGGAYARLVAAQDISGEDETEKRGREEDDEVEGGESAEFDDVLREKTKTREDALTPHNDLDYDKVVKMNLLKCLVIMLGEQRGMWWLYITIAGLCILAGATYPAQAILMARAVEAFTFPTVKEILEQGNFWALMYFVVALGNLVLYFLLGILSNIICQMLTHYYRREMFAAVLRQDMRFFDRSENTTGALTSRLSSQPTALQELMGFNLSLILIILVNLTSSTALAIAYGWKLGLVVFFGGLPPMVGAGWLRIRLERKLEDDIGRRFAASAALAGEAVGAIRTVASLALETEVLKRFEDALQNIVRRSIKSVLWTMFWFALTQSVDFLSMALGFWFGGKLLSTGEYTLRQFFVVYVGLIFSGQAAATFFMYTTSISKAIGASNYIIWLRNLVPKIREDDSNKDRAPGPDDGSLSFESLKFSYEQRASQRVLKGINLHVDKGSFIGLVGASGCGKSTMISLLERFYDPSSGRVLFGPNDLHGLSPVKYRTRVALVQQEPTLFSGTIRENVLVGLPPDTASHDGGRSDTTVNDASVESALRQANAYEFVSSLPEGLNTPCGPRGLSLSGGQRQRIAIARALIRNPTLLLLDEATSALDTESEQIVQRALTAAAQQRTTVAVAHRLSTVFHADRLFVFHDGHIVEEGTHQELMKKKGRYYEMCLAQSLDRAV